MEKANDTVVHYKMDYKNNKYFYNNTISNNTSDSCDSINTNMQTVECKPKLRRSERQRKNETKKSKSFFFKMHLWMIIKNETLYGKHRKKNF